MKGGGNVSIKGRAVWIARIYHANYDVHARFNYLYIIMSCSILFMVTRFTTQEFGATVNIYWRIC